MRAKGKLTLVIVFVGAIMLVTSGFLFYKNMMTPTPDNEQSLSTGTISALKMFEKEIDYVHFEGSVNFQEESVNKSLDAPKAFVVTNDTLVYKKTGDGRREVADIHDLINGQQIEVWTHFLSDHLIGAYEITILH